MYKSYQPFNPDASCYQQRWDARCYSIHLDKVKFALPVVDTGRVFTSANTQYKKKKLQDKRMSAARRDNRLLASRLKDNRLLAARMKDSHLLAARMKENRLLAARMAKIKSTVSHRNENSFRSLHDSRRKQDLVVISEENQALYQRLLSRKSVYSREHLLDDWMKTEYLLARLARYPHKQPTKQRQERKEKKVTSDKQDQLSSKSTTDRSKEIPRDHLHDSRRKQDLVVIGGKNQAIPRKSVYSRERFLAEWKKTEVLRQHLARFPREQPTKQRQERKEKKMIFDKQDEPSSKSTTGRSKEIPRDHLKTGKRKQDLVVIGGKNQGTYQRRLPIKSVYSRERFLTEWMKMEPLRQHLARYPQKQAPARNQSIYQGLIPRKSVFSRKYWLADWKKTKVLQQHLARFPREQPTKQRLQRKEKKVTVDKQVQTSSKSTTGRSKKIPGAK